MNLFHTVDNPLFPPDKARNVPVKLGIRDSLALPPAPWQPPDHSTEFVQSDRQLPMVNTGSAYPKRSNIYLSLECKIWGAHFYNGRIRQ